MIRIKVIINIKIKCNNKLFANEKINIKLMKKN